MDEEERMKKTVEMLTNLVLDEKKRTKLEAYEEFERIREWMNNS